MIVLEFEFLMALVDDNDHLSFLKKYPANQHVHLQYTANLHIDNILSNLLPYSV